MLNHFTFPDAITMHDSMCERLLFGKLGQDYNWCGTSEVGIDNLTIGLESFDYDFDFKRMWMTRNRWNLMVRQYIDADALDETMAKIEMYLIKGGKAQRGIAAMRLNAISDDEDLVDPDDPGTPIEELRTKLVKSRKTGRWTSRRWGSCMLSLTYRNVPRPTVTLNSRTSYFGMLAMMDVTVANVFARMCAERIGIHVGDIQFVWQLNLAQWHGFRSLAWPLGDDDVRAELERYVDKRDKINRKKFAGFYRSTTGYSRIVKLDREGVLYGDESFASTSRLRKRFHVEVYGKEHAAQFRGGEREYRAEPFPALPSLSSTTLTFDPAYKKGKRSA